MATDEALREIQDSLRRLERKIEGLEEPSSASGRGPRPTEQFSKIELEIRKAIETHAKDCAAAWKERLIEKIDPVSKKVEKVESRLEETKKDLGVKINGVKGDAAKTATDSVMSVKEVLDLYGKDIREVKEALNGTETEPGLFEMVRDFGQWVEREETARETARESSRFSITTILTVVGIIVAIGTGVVGIIW